MATATRRQGHGTAAEVVASVDVTVPTAVGDVAHVNICSLLAFLSRALHFTTAFFVCVPRPGLDSVKSFLGHHRMDARLFLTPKRGSSARQTSSST